MNIVSARSMPSLIIGLLTVALIISGILMAKHFYVLADYDVYMLAPCDPTGEICYIGDGAEFPEYYAYVIRPAYAVDSCVWNGDCGASACLPKEASCEMSYCDPESEGELCSTPLLQ